MNLQAKMAKHTNLFALFPVVIDSSYPALLVVIGKERNATMFSQLRDPMGKGLI